MTEGRRTLPRDLESLAIVAARARVTPGLLSAAQISPPTQIPVLRERPLFLKLPLPLPFLLLLLTLKRGNFIFEMF